MSLVDCFKERVFSMSNTIHEDIIDYLLDCRFSGFSFRKWDADLDVEFMSDGGEELIPRIPLMAALKTAMMDTERFWILILRRNRKPFASVEFRINPDDADIGEFRVSVSGLVFRFGYTDKGKMLVGDSPYGSDYVMGVSDSEAWVEFFDTVAMM